MEKAPWTIKVQVENYSTSWLLKTFLLYAFILLIITNAAFERIQNESQKLELIGQLAASTAHEI
jgi:hypothetical protein